MQITESTPGNRDSIASELRVTVNLLKGCPGVFRVQSRLRIPCVDTLQLIYPLFEPILMAIQVARSLPAVISHAAKEYRCYLPPCTQQGELFQGAGCAFCLLDVTKQPLKYHSHPSTPVSSNLIST